MKIKFKTSIATASNQFRRGVEYDVPDVEAKSHIRHGAAVASAPPAVETHAHEFDHVPEFLTGTKTKRKGKK